MALSIENVLNVGGLMNDMSDDDKCSILGIEPISEDVKIGYRLSALITDQEMGRVKVMAFHEDDRMVGVSVCNVTGDEVRIDSATIFTGEQAMHNAIVRHLLESEKSTMAKVRLGHRSDYIRALEANGFRPPPRAMRSRLVNFEIYSVKP